MNKKPLFVAFYSCQNTAKLANRILPNTQFYNPKHHSRIIAKMQEAKKIKKIKCPIFHSKNDDISKVAKAIKETETVKKKALLAERLIKEAEELLSCEHFDKKRVDCKSCRRIANLHKNTTQSKL